MSTGTIVRNLTKVGHKMGQNLGQGSCGLPGYSLPFARFRQRALQLPNNVDKHYRMAVQN